MVAILEFIIFAPTFLLILIAIKLEFGGQTRHFYFRTEGPLEDKRTTVQTNRSIFSWPFARDDGYLRKGHC
jgi:hypothetical protein